MNADIILERPGSFEAFDRCLAIDLHKISWISELEKKQTCIWRVTLI